VVQRPGSDRGVLCGKALSGVQGWRHIPTRANGQLAVGCYSWDREKGSFTAHVLDVLALRGDQIEAITSFIHAELFRSFGLPDQLRS
jgi:RNA polymerase sigma-70 factor, ECF subfamily